MTEKTGVFRIAWKIPRKSRLETRIKSTKNKGEGRNEFPEVKGIDTRRGLVKTHDKTSRRNEFPEVKGIDTIKIHNFMIQVEPGRNEFPEVKGIDTSL